MSTGVNNISQKDKKIYKLLDILGREIKGTNQPFFYIYDDGIVEKRITVE